jgi:hypothetical protein
MERALQYVYPKIPYRCKECWSRYWKFQSPFANRKSIIGILAIGLLAVLFLMLPFLPHQGNGVSSTGPEPASAPVTANAPDPPMPDSLAPAAAPNGPDRPDGPDRIDAGEAGMAEEPAADAAVAPPPVTESPLVSEPVEEAAAPSAAKAEAGITASPVAAPATEPPAETDDRPLAAATPPAAAPMVPAPESDAPGAPRSPAEPAGEATGFQRVTAIRQIEGADAFRIALESSGPIDDYAAFSMESPPRWVINISGKWEISGKRIFSMNDELVRRVRIGEHPKFLSVVLDLKQRVPEAPEIRRTEQGLTLTLRNG